MIYSKSKIIYKIKIVISNSKLLVVHHSKIIKIIMYIKIKIFISNRWKIKVNKIIYIQIK